MPLAIMPTRFCPFQAASLFAPFQSASYEVDSSMIRCDVIVRIFRNIHFNKITGAVKETPAIFTQMPQVQFLAQLLIAIGQSIDGLER